MYMHNAYYYHHNHISISIGMMIITTILIIISITPLFFLDQTIIRNINKQPQPTATNKRTISNCTSVLVLVLLLL